MNSIEQYLSSEQIENRITELAGLINRDYEGKDIVIVSVLKGSFIFCADLIRKIKIPLQVEFIAVSSYEGSHSSGQLSFKHDVSMCLENKHVILLEDIIDTGLTMSFLLKHFKLKNPASLKLCSLLFKPARLKTPVEIDYLGFEIEDKFVIGMGLDYNGCFRELPYIGVYNGH